jgi:hypothetical protein
VKAEGGEALTHTSVGMETLIVLDSVLPDAFLAFIA